MAVFDNLKIPLKNGHEMYYNETFQRTTGKTQTIELSFRPEFIFLKNPAVSDVSYSCVLCKTRTKTLSEQSSSSASGSSNVVFNDDSITIKSIKGETGISTITSQVVIF
jgi:hypothetical protein